MLSQLVVLYLFLGGASAGAFLLTAAWSFVFSFRQHDVRTERAFENLQRHAYTTEFALFVLAGVALFFDLGSPERVLLVFFSPRATILTFGSFAILAEVLVGGPLMAIHLFSFRVPTLVQRVLEVLCCVVSLAVIAYTGCLLWVSAVALWRTVTIVWLFVFSSFSSGVSIVLLVEYLSKSGSDVLRQVKALQAVHLACLVLEAVALALFTWHAFATPEAIASIALLRQPDMLATATVGVVGFGIVLPFCCEAYSLFRKEIRTIPASDAMCLMGGFLLRFVIISCGVL